MLNLKPLVSIIIPTYNSEKTIKKTLDSVVLIKKKEYELIIIDGKSKDETLNILKDYNNIIDKMISEPDQGIYDAMNKGVNIAEGKWIYFLGSDDILTKDFNDFTKQLKKENTIYYGNVFFGNINKIYDGYFNKYKLTRRNICQQSIFYPRKIFEEYYFNTEYKVLADYYLNILLYSDFNYRFEYIDKVICLYSNSGFSSKFKDIKFIKDKGEIIKDNLGMDAYLFYSIMKLLSLTKKGIKGIFKILK